VSLREASLRGQVGAAVGNRDIPAHLPGESDERNGVVTGAEDEEAWARGDAFDADGNRFSVIQREGAGEAGLLFVSLASQLLQCG
jgi:hypothetical protein